MATAFGPLGPNFSLTRPPADPQVSTLDTWCKNCSERGAKDGTFATADFFNVIIANLREAVRGSAIPLDNTNDTMLLDAINAIATNIATGLIPNFTASMGVKLVAGDIRSTLGDGSRPVLT